MSKITSKTKADMAMEQLREFRNRKLAESDWMSNSDSPTMSAEWKTYRQALRDITKQTPKLNETNDDGPLDITWPTEPS